MLIPSPKHTAADLRLWKELEAADAVSAKDYRLRQLHAQALNVLIEYTLNQPPCFVGVSWGKDSVAVAHLAWCSARTVPLVYLRQSTENPDCLAVRDAYFSRFQGQPYCEIPVVYGTGPVSHANDAWKAACKQANDAFGRRILGIRADESGVRKIGLKTRGLLTENTCSPIGWWTAADVFAYLHAEALPLHPVYAMLGGGRYKRHHLRTASIGGQDGNEFGRAEHEREYYGDELRRIESTRTRKPRQGE